MKKDDILTLEEAASYLKMNAEVLRRQSIAGEVPGAFRRGKLWRYRREELIGKEASK